MSGDIRFGFEFEVLDGAASVLSNLGRDCTTTSLHEYHCHCGDCDPERHAGLFTGQRDETVDGEFITKILTYDTDEHREAVRVIARAALKCGASLGADTSGSAGNHVHVNRRDAWADCYAENPTLGETWAWPRLTTLVSRFRNELKWLASGRNGELRDYNGEPNGQTMRNQWRRYGHDRPASSERPRFRGRPAPDTRHVSSWLAFKHETVEFRLWNSTAAPWRLNMHIGMSIALMRAAGDPQLAVTERSNPGTLPDILGPYMDEDAWTGLLMQDLFIDGKDIR